MHTFYTADFQTHWATC